MNPKGLTDAQKLNYKVTSLLQRSWMTDRPYYSVTCRKCGKEVASGTTSPSSVIAVHESPVTDYCENICIEIEPLSHYYGSVFLLREKDKYFMGCDDVSTFATIPLTKELFNALFLHVDRLRHYPFPGDSHDES